MSKDDSHRREGAGDFIGASVPRPGIQRLLSGRGRYTDDIRVGRPLHVAFLRSPHAHARIVGMDTTRAATAPGVVRVATGADIARLCKPYLGVLTHMQGLRSVPQHPLALDRARWQGEPVAVVAAESRAQAEDAVALIEVDWEPLDPVVDPVTALDPSSPAIHPELGDNLAYGRSFDSGGVDEAFASADAVVEATIETGRHTHCTLEPRTMLASYEALENHLTVWHSTQVPYMMQWILAHHFGLPEINVRVIAPDVGGSFGLKIHTYGDDMATVAMALMTGRAVKYVADRVESFVSDFHARGHRVSVRMAVSRAQGIVGVQMDDLHGVGAFTAHPRGGANEAKHVLNLVGAPYRNRVYRGRTRMALQNKAQYGQYRAVGHPIACAVTEALVDLAAEAIGQDPAGFRRDNFIPADAYPYALVTGPVFEQLSQHAALDLLLGMMDYSGLRAEQGSLRARGIHRGIGLAAFVEGSNHSSATYGQGGASIASQDGCTIKLTATGGIVVSSSLIDTGQGAGAVIAQIAASAVGVGLENTRVVIGDTEVTPYGGGVWGSRGTGIGGEAVLLAGRALRANVLAFVARLLEREPSMFDVRGGVVVDAVTGAACMTLEEVARTAYFRTDRVPRDYTPELTVTRSYAQKTFDSVYTNGAQGAWVEVDVDTGFIRLLRHWVVDDCGTVINPLLVDEQIRGGVVQGIGAALFEECLYDDNGQLLNGSLADYLVPMAFEMPDIDVGHVTTPTATSTLGAKGGGEAGTAGASAAILNAVNDALRPLGARVDRMPITPERVLRALGRI